MLRLMKTEVYIRQRRLEPEFSKLRDALSKAVTGKSILPRDFSLYLMAKSLSITLKTFNSKPIEILNTNMIEKLLAIHVNHTSKGWMNIHINYEWTFS